jgi:hypothetical protein
VSDDDDDDESEEEHEPAPAPAHIGIIPCSGGMDSFSETAGGSSVPMFHKGGTALSFEERAEISRRKGVCARCGVKTHKIKFNGIVRTPLTNDDVFEGLCIRDEPDKVPKMVMQGWNLRNKPALHTRSLSGPAPQPESEEDSEPEPEPEPAPAPAPMWMMRMMPGRAPQRCSGRGVESTRAPQRYSSRGVESTSLCAPVADKMKIPDHDEDPLELSWSTLNMLSDEGRVFPTASSDEELHFMDVDVMEPILLLGGTCSEDFLELNPSFYDDLLESMVDSERSIDVPTEGKQALELDESRPENGSNEAPQLVISPAVNDVLSGRGGKIMDHNLHYTRLCAQVADEYEAAKKGVNGKQGVALRVVRDVQQVGGRFLKPSSSGRGWDELSEEESVGKALHCIRDVINKRRRQESDSFDINAPTGVPS